MKNIRKIVHAALLTLSLAGAVNESKAQTISNHFFGQNAWMPDTVGNASACTEPPCILNGKLHQNWGNIKNSGATIIRFGGIAADKNMPTNFQYLRLIDSVRSNGMEPVIQVPYYQGRYSAAQAAEIVHYLNVVKSKHIKYWIIGNEPNLGYSYSTASQIANYFKPFASAMKTEDPSILIIGPEIAWFDQTIINGLTTPGGPDDITGKDAAGRYYLDVISFHTYPFNGSQTRSQVVTKLTSTGSLQDNLVYLNGRVAACNSAHGRTGSATLLTAITEANINWQNSPTDNLYGVGANSFIGGQFIAEMMGIGMKNGLDFINIWSVVEGNSTTSSIGYIESGSNAKKPAFYHYQMIAKNMKGTYADGTTNKPNVKSFASKNSTEINVVIMNEDLTSDYNYTVRLNTAAIAGTSPLKVNINAGVAMEHTEMVPNQSTVVLTFNTAGTLLRKTEYSLSVHAVASSAPTVTTYVTTGVEEPVAATPLKDDNFEINIFPNPSVGKFMIALNNDNTEGKSYEVEMVNLIGQQVYDKKSTFVHGKQEVEFDQSLATGVYIVRVRLDDKVQTKKIVFEKK